MGENLRKQAVDKIVMTVFVMVNHGIARLEDLSCGTDEDPQTLPASFSCLQPILCVSPRASVLDDSTTTMTSIVTVAVVTDTSTMP